MGTTATIPVEEYLATSYSPDVEYVDGVLVERNVGEKPHSKLQSNLVFELRRRYPNLYVWPELRMRSVGKRHRIPDVCVTLGEPETDVLQEAPYIAIEILSNDDTMTGILEKLSEYDAIGVANIWVFDPWERIAWTYRGGVLSKAIGESVGTLDGQVRLALAEVFG